MKRLPFLLIFCLSLVPRETSAQSTFPRGVYIFSLAPVNLSQMHDTLGLNLVQACDLISGSTLPKL